MCKILMTVSADAEEKTEPNRVQKKSDLSFLTLRGGTNLIIVRGKKLRKKRQRRMFFRKKLLKSIKAGLQLPPTSVKGPVA
jgi:hypothetical protein